MKEWKAALDHHLQNSDDRFQWKKLIEQHNLRAEELLNRDHLEKAADEWERSLVLNPMDKDIRFKTAQLYRSIYENVSLNKIHRQRSIFHLERLKKDFPSFKGVKNLEKDLLRLSQVIEPQHKDRSGIFLIFLPLILAMMLAVLTQRELLWETITGWFDQEETNLNVAVERPVFYGPKEVKTFGFDSKEFTLSGLEGKILQWNGRDALSLQGKILSKELNIDKMVISLRLLGKDNRVHKEKLLGIPDKNTKTLRKGESFVLDYFTYLTVPPEEISSLSLILEEWESTDIPIGKDDPVLIRWEKNRPDGVRLKSKVHQIEYSEGYDRLFYTIDIQLENRGRDRIDDLVLELEGYSSGFSPFEQEMLHPVNILGPPLLPGEKRPFSLFFSVNHLDLEPLKDLHLTVKEIQNSR